MHFIFELTYINSRSPLLHAIACPIVTFVHPTPAIEIFGNISTPFGTLPVDIQVKFYGDRPRGTSPSGELNTRGVAEYGDVGSIERCISLTVQDRS